MSIRFWSVLLVTGALFATPIVYFGEAGIWTFDEPVSSLEWDEGMNPKQSGGTDSGNQGSSGGDTSVNNGGSGGSSDNGASGGNSGPSEGSGDGSEGESGSEGCCGSEGPDYTGFWAAFFAFLAMIAMMFAIWAKAMVSMCIAFSAGMTAIAFWFVIFLYFLVVVWLGYLIGIYSAIAGVFGVGIFLMLHHNGLLAPR